MRSVHLGAGEWWAIGSAVSYAFGNVLTRVVSVQGDPLAGSIIRTLPVAAIGLTMMAWNSGQTARLWPSQVDFLGWRAVWLLIVYSLVNTPLITLTFYLAFRYGGVLIAAPVTSVHPLVGALIAVPFLGEAFNRRIGGGIAAALAGITLLTYGQHIGTPVSPMWPLGLLYALLTAFGFGVGANLNRYLLPRGVSVASLLGFSSVGAIVVLGLILGALGRFGTLTEFSPQDTWGLLISGGLSGLGSFTLFNAFARTTVASASTLQSLNTGLAALIAVWALGEVINLPVGLGLLLIVGGTIVVQAGKVHSSSVTA